MTTELKTGEAFENAGSNVISEEKKYDRSSPMGMPRLGSGGPFIPVTGAAGGFGSLPKAEQAPAPAPAA